MPMEGSDSTTAPADRFHGTVWDDVLILAGDPAAPGYPQASERFCQTYRDPVYWFVRRKGHLREEAEDLTQDFFAWLFEARVLADVTRNGGKFRSFLVTVLKNFLAHEREKWRAGKRAGGKVHISFDDTTETRYLSGLTDQETPEALFDRKYVQGILEQVFTRLAAEYAARGSGELFGCLKGCLSGDPKEVSYQEATHALGMTIEAVWEAAHRLRRRYGVLLRQAVAAPSMTPEEIDEELHYLINLLNPR